MKLLNRSSDARCARIDPTFLTRAWAHVRLIHPFPVSVVVVTTGFMLVIAHEGNPGINVAGRAIAVVLMSQIAVGALNDYLDRDQDTVVQPDKPIPAGLVRPQRALALVIAALVGEILLAPSFGRGPFLVAAIGTIAGLAYDLWLKPTPFSVLGYVIGFLSLVTWIWAAAGKFNTEFLLVYPTGAVLLIAAHLANSFPDIETDLQLGQRGMAALLGPTWTFRIIVMSYSIVELAGLSMATARQRPVAIILLAISGVAIVVMLTWCRQAAQRLEQRDRLFRVVAPGIGTMAAGCLLAVVAQ